MLVVEDFILQHMSTKPWSDYQESDYTLQQWHDACLIHLHDGADYTKADCKLPVKTPDGAVNKFGVFAAAAALSGARSDLKAPDSEKKKAAKQLVKLYQSMNKKPPDAVTNLAHSGVQEVIDGFLHDFSSIGINSPSTPSLTWAQVSDSLIRGINTINTSEDFAASDLTKDDVLRQQYDDLVEKLINDRLVSLGVLPLNKVDENAFLYHFDREKQRLIQVPVQVAHQNAIDVPEFSVNLDEEGFIVGIKAIKPKDATGQMWQSNILDVLPDDVIEHFGIRGMHWGVRHKPQKFGPSKDAKRTTASLKKAKSSSVKALTNKELRDLTQRMELERKYHQGLPPNAIQKGQKHVKAILAAVGITSAASIPTFLQTKQGKRLVGVFKRQIVKRQSNRKNELALKVLSKSFK